MGIVDKKSYRRWLLATVSFVVLLSPFVVLWYLQAWGDRPLYFAGQRDLSFPPQTRLQQLADDLVAQRIIDSSLLFKLLVRWNYDFQKFQAGDYRFSNSTTARQVIERIIAGEVHQELVLQLAIPEGFTLKKIIARLVKQGVGQQEELTTLAHDQQFLASLTISAPSLEGYLYPATYRFYQKLPDGQQAFSAMVAKLRSVIPDDYHDKLAQRSLTFHQALTMASLIELETAHDDERPLVAEVIWSRLKDNAPLGIDASIIYGIKDYRGDLTWQHLKDRNNPYNSRVHKGLPPTPIASPSLSSLLAVVNPSDEGNYFYVLIPDGKKRHHFSKSLREHNRHVRKLIRATRR